MELTNKSTTDDIELYLKKIGKDAGISAEVQLGEASYDRFIVFPIIIYNETSCCSVQIGQYFPNSTDDVRLDADVLKTAQEMLDKLEFQEEHGDFIDLEELAFVILDSGEYSLFISTESYSGSHHFSDLSLFEHVLKNKLYDIE
jgi:hypothetical protein